MNFMTSSPWLYDRTCMALCPYVQGFMTGRVLECDSKTHIEAK